MKKIEFSFPGISEEISWDWQMHLELIGEMQLEQFAGIILSMSGFSPTRL